MNLMMWLYDMQQNEFAAEMTDEDKIIVKPLAAGRIIVMTANLPMLIQIGQALTIIQNREHNSGLVVNGEGRWMKEFKVMQVLTWENVWPLIEMTEQETSEVNEIGGIYFEVEDWK